eukprot:gnl/TRDRNA2_/TRDRNA2_140821_c0_seq1.p1 gnl/TRDRNA2_/TRDRNA2_140821_c0~~gnl/TRDRNA2_/TRDRNA2_140821_c0_seq1.p1  ORF type:complete len:565 (+),score=53.53 gnl/TRDRNA2_/TRDRNA2_140821_c0_seq1:179-1696(+)
MGAPTPIIELVLFVLLVVPTCITGSHLLFSAATVVRIALRTLAQPWIWESELWSTQNDLVLLACVWTVAKRGEDVAQLAAPAIRLQTIAFYAGAAVWKLNSSFLNPSTSCGTIFIMQLIDAFAPAWMSPTDPVVQAIGFCAPIAAAAIELALPLLMLLGEYSRPLRRVALAAGLFFHLLVILTPPPNNAGGFSVSAAKWLFFFAPAGAVATVLDNAWASLRGIVLCAVMAASAAVGVKVGTHMFFFDTAPTAYALQLPLLCLALVTTVSCNSTHKLPRSGFLRALAGFSALIYAFVLPSLGLFDQGAPNMFSNQRFHGGSNHFFMPTGLLHGFLKGKGMPFEIVRVENSTSPTIAAQYPSEVTGSFTPRVREFLQAVGHTGRQWNPMLGRVVGLHAVAGPVNSPSARYTLMAFELQRLISEARAHGESFTVEYSVLSGLHGDEHWRASSGRSVLYSYDAQLNTETCEGDCVLATPMPWWFLKFVAFQPLPVLPGESWSEVHCYGP